MKIDSKNPSEVPREIDLAVDIEYSGGFVLSLDVDLIFGRTASLSIKLNKLIGRVRLQYTRNPCTHWSFSFYEVIFTYISFCCFLFFVSVSFCFSSDDLRHSQNLL